MQSGPESGRAGRLAPLAIGLMLIVATLIIAAVVTREAPPPDPDEYADTCGTGPGRLDVSHASGFYEGPFSLTVSSANGANIFYTLDGTRPETRSTRSTGVYAGPVLIQDLSSAPGPLSGMRTSSYVAPWNVDSPTWALARPGMDRGVPVRLRTAEGLDCTFVYFVGDRLERDLPVMHLTLNPDFLFDHDNGIYVLGAHFQEHRDQFHPDRPWETVGNFSLRGREWERPFARNPADSIDMHYFTEDGELAYSSSLGIRIHGATSRTFPLKSLRLYARNEYGNRSFDYPFFGDDGPEVHRRLLLRAAGSHCMCVPDWRDLPNSHLTDGYLQSLVRHRDIDSQGMVPIALFINGEYWGIHHIRDRLDEHYVEIAHGIAADQVTILESEPPLSDSSRPEWAPIFAILDSLTGPGMSDQDLARMEAGFDLDNYLEWLTVQLFVANNDIFGNYSLWRAEVPVDGGQLHPGDGRWRWLLYDLDWYDFDRDGASNSDMFAAMETGRFGELPTRFYTSLVQNDDFVARLVNRIADHLNTTYLPERTVPILDALEAALVTEMQEHIDRWAATMGHDLEGWHRSVDHLRTFMVDRPTYLWDQVLNHFNLIGTAPVRLLSDQGGVIAVNSLTIDESTPGVGDASDWIGRYFVGVPIELTAIPRPGFIFSGWDGVPAHLADQSTITVDLDGDLEITARFAESG